MKEVEKRFKGEITAELREEYSLSKMGGCNNPIPPAPPTSNIGFSNIKTEP